MSGKKPKDGETDFSQGKGKARSKTTVPKTFTVNSIKRRQFIQDAGRLLAISLGFSSLMHMAKIDDLFAAKKRLSASKIKKLLKGKVPDQQIDDFLMEHDRKRGKDQGRGSCTCECDCMCGCNCECLCEGICDCSCLCSCDCGCACTCSCSCSAACRCSSPAQGQVNNHDNTRRVFAPNWEGYGETPSKQNVDDIVYDTFSDSRVSVIEGNAGPLMAKDKTIDGQEVGYVPGVARGLGGAEENRTLGAELTVETDLVGKKGKGRGKKKKAFWSELKKLVLQ